MVDFIIVLIVAVLLLLALRSSLRRFSGRSTCCGDVRVGKKGGEKHLDGPVIGTMKVRISGMECESCARRVKAAIDGIDGALASVDYKSGYAAVSYDRTLDEAAVRDAVKRSGYKVESIG